MRPLYENDILSRAKPIEDLKSYSVYFLITDNIIIYVGFSERPNIRIRTHLTKFTVHKYHIINFENRESALAAETHYIKTLKPYRNISHNEDNIKPRREANRPVEIVASKMPELIKVDPRIITKKVFDGTGVNPFAPQPITKIEPTISTPSADFTHETIKVTPRNIVMADQVIKDLILTDDKINLLNGNYIKKGSTTYLKIDNKLFKLPEGATLGRYKSVKYMIPKKLFGNLLDIMVID
jgi:predicted GIY-YIG superfamily endonuclease